jgi:hypothetical protein
MVRYIDHSLTINSSRTRRRIGWSPRDRLLIERRIPFLVEHLKTDPVEWHRLNRAALKKVTLHNNLRIYHLLEKHRREIGRELMKALQQPADPSNFPRYQRVERDLLEWRYTQVLRHLLNAIRTRDKGIFTAYCGDMAERRFKEGFTAGEVCSALNVMRLICLRRLQGDPESEGLESDLADHVNMTVQFGCDQVQETFEELGGYSGDTIA